jgi:hypothetical protein
MTEASGREIVLSRMLRACATPRPESALLDFTIALEAALLKGSKTELSYRFALYDALFLREELDPIKTFGRLRKIYDNRSKLVHGGKLSASDLHATAHEAAELAKAVTRKAIESGWPDAEKLTAQALDFPGNDPEA